MSERKAINKYYPPDFDPSKVTKKRKKVRTGTASLPTVRLMTPFSLKCTSCGEYISKSRKFNARKETTTEVYMGMKILRFHMRCPSCAGEIIFKTDYKTADYVLEAGATKNYENAAHTEYQLKSETLEETLKRLEREEKEERLEALNSEEKRTTVEELEEKLNVIKRQSDLNEEIEGIREHNALLESAKGKVSRKLADEEEDNEDEKLATEAFSKVILPRSTSAPAETSPKKTTTFTKKRKVSKIGVKIRK